jgi:DNA-binding response OmpR family regulator
MSIGKLEFLKEAVEKFDPDLIILDLYVRGGILWNLLGELKTRYPATPILLFTALHPKELPLPNEADGWAEKSFLFEDLKHKIQGLLERKKETLAFTEAILAKASNQIVLPGPSVPAALPWIH